MLLRKLSRLLSVIVEISAIYCLWIGRSQCSQATVTVQLLVGAISPASCTVFAGFATPYSTCQLVVPPGTFTTSGVTLAVAVRLMVNAVIVQTTSLGNVYLAPLPTQTNPVAVGIYFQAPIYAAVPGDTIALRMYFVSLCFI